MYKSEIIETSRENMTPIEKVAYKDLSDCELLDVAVNNNNGSIIIEIEDYVKLHVYNDKTENKEYDVLVLVSKDGTRYKTGSESFERAFFDIYSELKDETGWGLKVFGKPSKNYQGKLFLTCSAVVI